MTEALEKRLADMEKTMEALKLAMDTKEAEAASARAEAQAAKEELQDLLRDQDKSASPDESLPKPSPSLHTPDQGMSRTLYISSGRKLERFGGRPEKAGDPSAEDWIEDAQLVMASKSFREDEQAAFLMEHLFGKARREILGRGDDVRTCPKKIFQVLSKVFGDTSNLAQLQQRFYGYRQAEGEDIVSLSLELVKLFDRMIVLDPTLKHTREAKLEDRLAEAVKEEAVQVELRRLASDKPHLSFFDTRDHLIKIMGKDRPKGKREAVVRETTVEGSLNSTIRKQEEQIAAQQTQIQTLLTYLQTAQRKPRPKNGAGRCWNCNESGHFKRECPHPPSQPNKDQESGPVPPTQSSN